MYLVLRERKRKNVKVFEREREKIAKVSSPKGDRTLDLKINSPALYLLSYQRISFRRILAINSLVDNGGNYNI